VADVVSVAIYGTQENGLIDTSRLLYKSLPAARKYHLLIKCR
jgi:sialidase-1